MIGASRDASSIGGRLFHNLLMSGFHGPVYPVNPRADVVHGVVAYPTVTAVPGEVDVAFVVVPAAHVADVARECGAKGVRGLVVISAGFAEVGGDGPARQDDLVEICRAYGMRIIGPNCMGIVNTSDEIRLNGTFATVYPPRGRVGFLSQSGALGLAVMQYATEVGVGLSSFVSVGNKADISGNDLVAYWDEDPDTDVVLLYLESFGNPRRFARLARDVGRRKPIIAVKSGRSAAGARAAASHTGALLAASDVTVDALFRQSGVIRTDTLEEMFDVATILANQPPPRGDRVAIVTNAGGLGILCADTLRGERLEGATAVRGDAGQAAEVPSGRGIHRQPDRHDRLGDRRRLRPRDQDGRRGPRRRRDDRDLHPAGDHQGAGDRPRDRGRARADRRADPGCHHMDVDEGAPDGAPQAGARIPSFAFPEQAAIAMAHAARYGAWRERPAGTIPHFHDTRIDEAVGIIANALGRGDARLAHRRGGRAPARLLRAPDGAIRTSDDARRGRRRRRPDRFRGRPEGVRAPTSCTRPRWERWRSD